MQTIWLGEAGDQPAEEEHYRGAPPPDRRDTIEPAYPLDLVEPEETMDAQLINWRGRLTEFCQKRDLTLPDVNEINPVGARGTFSFVCKFSWGKANSPPLLVLRTCGTAKKKKFAKREAARLMCKRMSDLTSFHEPMHNDHNPEDRGYWGPSFPACPRSADESGEVCPPLGYEEFDHSEPLPDLYGYGGGYDDEGYGDGYNDEEVGAGGGAKFDTLPGGGSMYLSKRRAPWQESRGGRGRYGGYYGPAGGGPMSKRRRFGDYDERDQDERGVPWNRPRGRASGWGGGYPGERGRGGGSLFLN